MRAITFIVILLISLGIFMANHNTSPKTIEQVDGRYTLEPWIANGLDPFVEKIGYVNAVLSEPKDEYVAYAPNQLVDYFTQKGWKAIITAARTDEEYGDIEVYISLSKDDLKFMLFSSFYRSGSTYASERFIRNVTASSAMYPPYDLIAREQGLGTLAIYDYYDPQCTVYWFYRNTYTGLLLDQELEKPSPSAEQMTLALEIQQIFNEHTKKIAD